MMYQNSSGSKAQLLQKINEVSFAVNDILLYLDTHPCCEKGMALYREYAAERKKLMEDADNLCGIMKKDCSIPSTLKPLMRSLLSLS